MKFYDLYRLIVEMHGDKWAGTSWSDTTKDGKQIKVTIQDIFNYSKNFPETELGTDSLKSIALHTTKNDQETLNNIQKANLQYPILVLKKENNKMSILDGHHRLQKAINNKIPKIKAKILDIKNMPKDWQWLFR